MVKCAACGKFLGVKAGAVCSNSICTNRYHFACLLLPESTQMSNNWKCPDCKKKIPKGDNSSTPVKQLSDEICAKEVILSDCAAVTGAPDATTNVGISTTTDLSSSLSEEIRLFRSELRAVRDELRAFRSEMAELHSSFGDCNRRIDGLEARIEALETKQVTDAPDNTLVSQLQHTISRLQYELNDKDQEALSTDLEISNLPEVPGENLLHTVELVASKLGVTLEERDIVFVQRVGLRVDQDPAVGASAARARRIVVRLARRTLRDVVLQNARVRRGANTADLGLPTPPRRFYVNERLTRFNKQLFYRVREVAGRLGWRYTWTKFGRILTKQSDGKPTHCIRADEDLVRVFGSDVVSNKKN